MATTMEQTTCELKRCPFCGGYASYVTVGDSDNQDTLVVCNDCYAEVRAKTEKDAQKKWNKRACNGIEKEEDI